jgi:hypothetical protein
MAILLQVDFNDTTHTVEARQSDLARVEEHTQTSVARLGVTPIRMWLTIAYYAMRRLKIEGVPDTYDAFLDLGPSVDLDTIETTEGKGSGQDPPTGESSAPPSKPGSPSET